MVNFFGFFGSKDKPKRVKPLVLHIDDDQDILAMLRTYLETMELDALSASSGQDGIDLARKEVPDLILLDVRMPGMDGFDACYQIKNDPKSKDIPVLMLTSMGQVKDIDKALANGASGYMVKPVRFSQLKAKISEFIKVKP